MPKKQRFGSSPEKPGYCAVCADYVAIGHRCDDVIEVPSIPVAEPAVAQTTPARVHSPVASAPHETDEGVEPFPPFDPNLWFEVNHATGGSIEPETPSAVAATANSTIVTFDESDGEEPVLLYDHTNRVGFQRATSGRTPSGNSALPNADETEEDLDPFQFVPNNEVEPDPAAIGPHQGEEATDTITVVLERPEPFPLFDPNNWHEPETPVPEPASATVPETAAAGETATTGESEGLGADPFADPEEIAITEETGDLGTDPFADPEDCADSSAPPTPGLTPAGSSGTSSSGPPTPGLGTPEPERGRPRVRFSPYNQYIDGVHTPRARRATTRRYRSPEPAPVFRIPSESPPPSTISPYDIEEADPSSNDTEDTPVPLPSTWAELRERTAGERAGRQSHHRRTHSRHNIMFSQEQGGPGGASGAGGAGPGTLPRQAPAPNHAPPPPPTTNGMNNGGGNMGPTPGGNMGGGPGAYTMNLNAGYSSDLQYVNSLLGELSDVLASNRAATEGIIRGADQILARANAEGRNLSMTEASSELQDARLATAEAHLADERARNAKLTNEVRELTDTVRGQGQLIHNYEDGVLRITTMVRNHAYNLAMDRAAVARQHHAEITAEREINMQLRLEQARIQEGLQRLSGNLRQAYAASFNYDHIREVAGLRAEIRSLRRTLGLPYEDSDDEKEEDEPKDGSSQ